MMEKYKHWWHSEQIKLHVLDTIKNSEPKELTYRQLEWSFRPGTVDLKVLDQVLRELCHDGMLDGIQAEPGCKEDDIFVLEV